MHANLTQAPETRRPVVVMESEPAPASSDQATRRTVERMCGYIRDAIGDPEARRVAELAWRKWGRSIPTAEMKAWGVFWLVKHAIRFRVDEATMFRVGLRDEQDLLISPSLLLRLKDPHEDCDGFTMLAAALLQILGVPVYIVTVAASHDRPSEFSHVFLIADTPSGLVPLDASHMVGPGKMVPERDILRWQAWTLDGAPADIRPKPFRGLHAYLPQGHRMLSPAGYPVRRAVHVRRRRGMRGLGQGETYTDPITGETIDVSAPMGSAPIGIPGAAPAGASTNWGALITGIAAPIGSALTRIFSPPAYQQVIRDPVTGALVSTTTAYATGVPSAALSTLPIAAQSPILWIGGGLLVLFLLSRSK